VLRADVVEVNWDGAYVSMVVHVCCKFPFPMFHLYVVSVFIFMLHMFHT
jgi:hypothetical protein